MAAGFVRFLPRLVVVVLRGRFASLSALMSGSFPELSDDEQRWRRMHVEVVRLWRECREERTRHRKSACEIWGQDIFGMSSEHSATG